MNSVKQTILTVLHDKKQKIMRNDKIADTCCALSFEAREKLRVVDELECDIIRALKRVGII